MFAKFLDVFAKFLVDDGEDFFFQMIDRVGAVILVQKSCKSELSSRFFGRLKFSPNSRPAAGSGN